MPTVGSVWPYWVGQGTTGSVWQQPLTVAGNVCVNAFTQGITAISSQTVWVQWQTTAAAVVAPPMPEQQAEQVLLEQLSEAQRAEWQKERAFTVYTAGGRRAYKIAYGLAGNVRLVRVVDVHAEAGADPQRIAGAPEGGLVGFYGWVPNEDNVLAQKLLIESNEAEFGQRLLR